jgi:serine/threonine-protein kinase
LRNYADEENTVVTELSPGATLAGYRIETLIGRGGMGVVYLAEDLRLSRKVALKLIAPGLAADPRFRERFLREAELSASLDHPHVLPVYGAGETDGRLWIAMRYVEGEDLATLLAREGLLAPLRAVELARQIGDALDAAHARGLVHRDVKPANVLVAAVAAGEHCYLTDFGLARASQDEMLTPTAAHLSGTIAYAAPERIAGRFVDGRADVYSLGCVLFECLAGAPPFVRRRPSATVAAHMDDQPPSVWSLRPELPSELDDIVARALAKEPGERYASCGELTQAARAALAPAEPWWRSRLALTASVLLLLVALASTLAVVLARGRTEAAPESAAIPAGDSLVRLDAATGEVVAAIELDGRPTSVVASDRHVWVGIGGGTFARIDMSANRVSATVDSPVPLNLCPPPTLDGEDLWLTCDGDAADEPWQAMRLTDGADAFESVELAPDLVDGWCCPAVAGGSLWVTVGPNLLRVDPDTGKVLARLENLGSPDIVGNGFAWASTVREGDHTYVRVDLDTNEIAVLPELPPVTGYLLAFGEGSVWMGNRNNETVVRLDPLTGAVHQPRSVIYAPFPPPDRDPWVQLTAGGGAVWFGDFGDPGSPPTVVRHDLTTLDVRTIDVGGLPMGLVFAGGDVWVAVDG